MALIGLALTACDQDYVETGDLPALREIGRLRILVPHRGAEEVLPRHGHPFDYERRLATSFAEDAGLRPVLVFVERHEDLIPSLVEGRGDLIVANLTVTPGREDTISFSQPVGWVKEQVIARAGDADEITGPADLEGRSVFVRRSSSYWATFEALQEEYPEIRVVPVPEEMDTEEIMQRVATGEFELTVADDNLAVEVLAYTPELGVAFDLSGWRPVAWGLRPGATLLRAAVDDYIERINLGGLRPERYRADLSEIRERGVLRILTRNSASTYYVWRGKLVGFEYDLARRFAERIGCRLEIVVTPTRASLLSWLRQGRGDVVAAGLTRTDQRADQGVAFSRPYNYAAETVVARATDSLVRAPEDLAGRTVVVRRSSSYWSTLNALKQSGIDLELAAAPESLETEEIIARVASGEYDLTVADSHILAIELTWRDDIRAAAMLGDSVAHAWAVRESNRELKAAIDRFFDDEYRGLFYNVTYNKYFRDPAKVRERVTSRPRRTGGISEYDALIRRYADRYRFDWRLIAAQIYQESRFRPSAKSFAGAVGLMQVLPSTARELGIDDPADPEQGIHAGVLYLRRTYDRIEDARSDRDRLFFALAAYNAGHGHVLDARRLAHSLGRDPAVWFGEVEKVMPLLSSSKHYQRARYGYCRCREPVKYVREILARYRAYLDELEGTAAD